MMRSTATRSAASRRTTWMMTKVLVYAYCVGVFSSRRIERRLVEDIAFRVLAAGNEPNFRTISDFRKIHLKTLEGLFEQVLHIALEAGAMKVGRVALDGTKIRKPTPASAKSHGVELRPHGREAKAVESGSETVIETSRGGGRERNAHYGRDRTGDELPAELERRETRLKKIREAKRRLGGKSTTEGGGRGQQSKAGEFSKEKDQYNFTDPESRIMKGADGFLQGYNAQAAVEPDLQLIVGPDRDGGAQRQRTVAADGGSDRTAERAKTGRDFSGQRLLLREESGGSGIGRPSRNNASKVTLPRSGRSTTSTARPVPRGRLPKGATRVDRMSGS